MYLYGHPFGISIKRGRSPHFPLIECRVFPLVSGSTSVRQFPIGPSFLEIGQAILGPILDIIQAIQECPDSDPNACHHFRYAVTLFLRANDGFLPGCVHQRETPFRGKVDFRPLWPVWRRPKYSYTWTAYLYRHSLSTFPRGTPSIQVRQTVKRDRFLRRDTRCRNTRMAFLEQIIT